MGKSSEKRTYFTKHLFGAGIECPTKLYYYSQNFPENKQSIPFIKHAVFNKRLLKALARTPFPEGIFIKEDSIADAAGRTRELLQEEEVVLFNAIFEHRQMMARFPIVQKKGNQLIVFHIQTKAFNAQKYQLSDNQGKIYDKWRSYILDFAYQLHLLRLNFPDADINPFLVMPRKTGRAYTNNLPALLKPLKDSNKPAAITSSNQELLVKLDVTKQIETVWDDSLFADKHLPAKSFEDTITLLRDYYINGKKEEPEVGLKCKNCEFHIGKEQISEGAESGFNECWSPKMATEQPTERHVFDLIGPGTNQWIKNGNYDQHNVLTGKNAAMQSIVEGQGRITQKMRQALQIKKAKGNNIPNEVIRPELKKELARWEYPLHFLDFEAGNYAVPLRKNRTPYHLVIFQFSCHTLYEDGSWDHHQWIDNGDSEYPNYELVRQLMKVSDIQEGTIIQYSNFERRALKTIRRELMGERKEVEDAGQLINWIEHIIQRNDSTHPTPPFIADLSRQVKHFYYNREMGNSLSIKDVLRSIMSYSDILRDKYSEPYSSSNFDKMVWWQSDGKGGARSPYNILNEVSKFPVQQGAEAMVAYGKLIARDLDRPLNQAYMSALLKYCELDTLAMLMIYQHWKHQ